MATVIYWSPQGQRQHRQMKYIIMLKYLFNNSINTASSTNNTITECHH